MIKEMNWRERPNVLPWPPLIFAFAAIAAFVLGRIYPLGGLFTTGLVTRTLGTITMLLGLGLDVYAMVEMRRLRANILPHRAATALVTTGPFALSRNPIYLGNTILVLGAALVLGNPWFLAAAVVAAVLVEVLAIRREEKHLAARFGAAWEAYVQRTPRWIGIRH